MAKIRQHLEKRERNEEYAKRFRKKKVRGAKKAPKFANWCRTLGHPASCQCAYPPKSEIPAGGRK